MTNDDTRTHRPRIRWSFEMGRTMHKALNTVLALAALGAVAVGCAEPGGDIDRTQNNLVDKSIFEGEWWYTRTVIGLDDDAAWAINSAGAGAPWPGAMANFDIASQSGVMGRIRWVIDEDFLIAYRSHEIIQGSDEEAGDADYRGQPLAIFPIDAHVDVRREYNGITGEPTNVISETQDRRWYDRQFLRVDWSQNLVTMGLFGAGLELEGLFASFARETTDFVQEGGDSRFPDSWRPQFVRIGDDPDYRFFDEWPADMADTVHYMSFVTNELWTPLNCPSDLCTSSIRLSLRHAFLRIPPNHEYAVETLPHSEYDRFGIIRTESRTFIAGGDDRSTVGRFCDAACTATCNFDEDCGAGGSCNFDDATGIGTCVAGTLEDLDDCGSGNACDYATGQCAGSTDSVCGGALCNLDTHMCEGGLTPFRGETDFLTFYRLRHNFYADSLDESRACVADWQCDNRYGTEDGLSPAQTDGSVCDRAAGLCTIPLRERPVRPVEYHLSPNYPRHLVRSAFEVMAQWNESFMVGNRSLHGDSMPQPATARVECQGTNPTDYCFCNDSLRAPEVAADGTCAYRSDFFLRPEDRPETDPFQCWIGLVGPDGTPAVETPDVNPGNPTSYDDYSDDVYRYAMIGDECMFILNVNSCDVPVADGEDPAACEELGDIRYQFFNYATGAGAGWCGVMQPLQDPTTGEAVAIPINMGGLCLDRIATNAVDLWPVLRGEISEDSFLDGEHVRGYYENLGNVHYPVGFADSLDGVEYDPTDPSRPALPVDLNAHLNDMFQNQGNRFLQLGSNEEGRTHIMSDRLGNLRGTQIERRLVSGLQQEGLPAVASHDVLVAANLNQAGQVAPDSEALLDQISPFRDNFEQLVLADRMREMSLANNYIYYPRDAIFTSRYNQYWANAFAGRPLEEAQIRWAQAFHRAVMLHEMGHGLGLEHNFAASYDRDHYHDGYYNLVTTEEGGERPFALPTLDEFDCGQDGLCPDDAGYTAPDEGERDTILTADESNRWAAAVREIRTNRAEAGIGNTMTSSLMDYNGDLSDMSGLGYYDRAAVYFNYFNLVEAFQGDPIYREGVSTSLDGLLRSDTTSRTLWTWYRGGESCNADTDCPNGPGSEALTSGQGIFQRCVKNPRYSTIPEPCGGDNDCICSTFDEDFIDYYEFVEPRYPSDADGDGVADHHPVEYLFCSNSRLSDISWCNVFDAGESFQETIDHFRQMWQEGYPRNYFRNYRRGFFAGSRASRYIVDAAKIFQHLFFRYFYEPEFRRETGPLGFNDQYLASADAMNWLAELAQLPDVGSYRAELVEGPAACDPRDPNAAGNPDGCIYGYRHLGEEMGMADSDISLAPGQGFYHWSQYQDGLYGFFRMERSGVFWDKLLAMRALTVRDWGLSFTIDERFFINFYDLFPIEMTELFGGYVIDDNRWIAPRVQIDETTGEAQVYYLNYVRGNCRDASTGEFVPCRDSNAVEYEQPHLMDTSNEILRLYAAIYALAEFPVFYDPSFESRLAVFKLDNADGFTIPDVQLDGEATQAFGAAIPGSGHAVTTDPEEADYIIFTSDRLSTPYVAVKVRERLTYNLEEEQLGFQLLLRLYRQQERVRALEAIADPTTEERRELTNLRRQLTGGESYIEALIEVQRAFGITSWL